MSKVPPGDALPTWEGRSLSEWTQALGLWDFHAYSSIGSTNDHLKHLVDAGARPWTVVVADEQMAGRGRHGKSWASPPGGLWCSLLVPSRTDQGLVPLAAGLAVADAAQSVCGLEVGLKWPNDVLYEGRKLAGILCEGTSAGVVVGIGLNVDVPEGGWPAQIEWPPIALVEALLGLGRPPGSVATLRGDLLSAIVAGLRERVESVGLADRIGAEYPGRDVLRDRSVLHDGRPAVARGIAADGGLRLERADGTLQTVHSGTIRLAE